MEAKQRILVVDDEPQLTRVLRRSLTTKGYDVRVAGDYVTKRFGMDELLARVRATLRRQPTGAARAQTVEAGDFRFDLETHTITQAGNELRLTPKEFDLMVYFIRNAGKVLTHRALLGAV